VEDYVAPPEEIFKIPQQPAKKTMPPPEEYMPPPTPQKTMPPPEDYMPPPPQKNPPPTQQKHIPPPPPPQKTMPPPQEDYMPPPKDNNNMRTSFQPTDEIPIKSTKKQPKPPTTSYGPLPDENVPSSSDFEHGTIYTNEFIQQPTEPKRQYDEIPTQPKTHYEEFPDSQTEVNFVPLTYAHPQSYYVIPAFKGEISRQEAEDMLAWQPDKTYIVRWQSQQKCYVVSYVNSQSKSGFENMAKIYMDETCRVMGISQTSVVWENFQLFLVDHEDKFSFPLQ